MHHGPCLPDPSLRPFVVDARGNGLRRTRGGVGHRSVQEVITNGINGLLVDSFRPDQLAQALSNVLDRPTDFDPIRKKARETVLAKYDLGSCLQQRSAWLSGLIASR